MTQLTLCLLEQACEIMRTRCFSVGSTIRGHGVVRPQAADGHPPKAVLHRALPAPLALCVPANPPEVKVSRTQSYKVRSDFVTPHTEVSMAFSRDLSVGVFSYFSYVVV